MERSMKFGQETLQFSGRGVIYSYTIMYHSPEKFQFLLPYVVAHIKLEEGPMVTSMLTDIDFDDLYIGMPVEMVTRKLSENGDTGLISYGYKFRPIQFG